MAGPFAHDLPQWGEMPDPAPLSGTGADGRLAIETGLGTLRVEAFARDILRLSIDPDRPLPDYGILVAEAEDLQAEAAASETGWHLTAGDVGLAVRRDNGHIDFDHHGRTILASADDGHFARPRRLPTITRAVGAWVLSFTLGSQTAVYGLGEKWGPLNKRGQLVVNHNEDALGVNAERSYKNAPFAWSPDGWGLFVHTPARVVHGVGYAPWSHRAYVLVIEDEALDLFFIAGQDGAAILERYTHLTGRTPMLPEWSFGVWLSRAYYKTPQEMLDVAHGIREAGVPADVITLDGRAWQDTDTRFAFEWDPKRFNDPKDLCDRLHAMNLRLCVWEYPLVSTANPLFDEMADKGWLLKDEAGQPYRYEFDREPFGRVLTPLPDSGLVDFTHPDAYAFWRDKHDELFDAGVDIIKSDFGEQVLPDMRAANGDDGARLHNVHALLYNRCVFEASERRFGKGEAIVFGRAGWAGSQRYPIQWGGDPQADWEGLAASLRGGLSWGLSGGACYATDIGGFYGGEPEDKLYLRWAQVGVFASQMRFHGIGQREPHLFDGPVGEGVRAMCRLRYRLIPYVRGAVAEAGRSGLPVMRALALAFPNQPLAWMFDLPYLFGPDLLVIPVTNPEDHVSYFLPDGDWYDFWTGNAVTGGRLIDQHVPDDRIPVFVRAGAVLALGPEVQHTGELADHDRIEEVRVYGHARFDPCLAEPSIQVRGGELVGVPAGTRVVHLGENAGGGR
jgi:alpha-D-xyloside xylohydrolase